VKGVHPHFKLHYSPHLEKTESVAIGLLKSGIEVIGPRKPALSGVEERRKNAAQGASPE